MPEEATNAGKGCQRPRLLEEILSVCGYGGRWRSPLLSEKASFVGGGRFCWRMVSTCCTVECGGLAPIHWHTTERRRCVPQIGSARLGVQQSIASCTAAYDTSSPLSWAYEGLVPLRWAYKGSAPLHMTEQRHWAYNGAALQLTAEQRRSIWRTTERHRCVQWSSTTPLGMLRWSCSVAYGESALPRWPCDGVAQLRMAEQQRIDKEQHCIVLYIALKS